MTAADQLASNNLLFFYFTHQHRYEAFEMSGCLVKMYLICYTVQYDTNR